MAVVLVVVVVVVEVNVAVVVIVVVMGNSVKGDDENDERLFKTNQNDV